jgi:hypothetical protein
MKQFITTALLLLNILLIARLASAKTQVRGNAHLALIQRNGSFLGVYTDGWVCYHRPNEIAVVCTRAIPKPTYKEIR